MPPRRRPWVKVMVDLADSDKVGALPNAAAKWGWTKTLLRAKTQRRMGVFGSRRHLADLLGREGRYVGSFIEAGLAHEVPDGLKDCGRCTRAYRDARRGELVVHDYRKEQRDPTNADRQADHRDRSEGADRNGESNAVSNDDRNGPSNGESNATGAAHSRAQGMTVTVTERESKAPTDSGVLLSVEDSAAWKDFHDPAWGPFREAWHRRGLKRPPFGEGDDPTSQRALLWEIADARPDDLGRWVAEAPERSVRGVIDHVLEQWHGAKREGAERADAQEAESAELRTETRADGKAAMTRIGDLLQGGAS